MKINDSLSFVRGAILFSALLLLVANAYSLTTWRLWIDPSLSGTLGVTLKPGLVDKRPRIERMDADSALAAAGAQVGDLIVFRHPGLRTVEFLPITTPIAATLYGAAGLREISLFPRPQAPGASPASIPYALIGILNRIMAIGLAVVIVLRKGKDGAMLAFAASLLANAPVRFASNMPVGWLQDWSAFFLRPLDFVSGYWLFLLFALMYPGQNALWRRRGVAPAMFAFGAIFLAHSCLYYWSRFGLIHLPATLAWVPTATSWFAVLTAMVTLAVLSRNWLTQTGIIRDRLGWILLSIGVTYVMWMVLNLMNALGIAQPPATPIVTSLINFLGYIGFGYALLRHRIFDFGFAVNRALVYTCISTLLLLLFGLTEFAVDKMLHFEGREKNIIFDAIVALGVILCFHRIQHSIAHRVDHTFFHDWHEAAERLKSALEQTAHIRSDNVLLERAQDALQKFTNARSGAIYGMRQDGAMVLRHGHLAGVPNVFEVDHSLTVAMRHTMIVTQGGEHGLQDCLVVPLPLRGESAGVLLLAGDDGSLNLRPDQLALMTNAAATIATQLEAVRIHELDARANALAERATELERKLAEREREANDLRAGLLDLRETNTALSVLAGIARTA